MKEESEIVIFNKTAMSIHSVLECACVWGVCMGKVLVSIRGHNLK